jgi:hypothetical protein
VAESSMCLSSVQDTSSFNRLELLAELFVQAFIRRGTNQEVCRVGCWTCAFRGRAIARMSLVRGRARYRSRKLAGISRLWSEFREPMTRA